MPEAAAWMGPCVCQAARRGDIELVRDHVTIDPTCVHKRGDLCDSRCSLRISPRVLQMLASFRCCCHYFELYFYAMLCSVTNLPCTPLLDMVNSMFVGFSSRPKPKSRTINGATPSVICAFANAGVIPVLFSTISYCSLCRRETPLYLSSRHGHIDVCRFLLFSKAKVNECDRRCDIRCYLRICKCGRDSGFVFNVCILPFF